MAESRTSDTPWAAVTAPSAPAGELTAHYDAIVVGAGIVGLCTAMLLAEAGRSVAVVEARRPGAGTTGRSTAKATLLQGTRASQIRHRRGAEVLGAYLTGNRAGLELIEGLADGAPEVGQPADAWTYATDERWAGQVRAEAAALQEAGVDAHLATPEELPFETEAAVRLGGQLRLDPGALLSRVLDRLAALGVPVAWPVRACGVRSSGYGLEVVATVAGVEDGEVPSTGVEELRLHADWVVLATLLPFPLRTALFASTSPQLSYAMVGEPTTAAVPQGMYLSAGQPSRSLRLARTQDGRELLLVGGDGHPVGQQQPASAHLAHVAEWADLHYGLHQPEQRWAAHDYGSADLLPHVGAAPFGPANLLVATGFGKWGMTNGAAAAIVLADTVLGHPPQWAAPLVPRIADGANGWAKVAARNADVGLALARGWVADPTGDEPGEGAGVVHRHLPYPHAISRVDGVRRSCSAVCTHLGGIVRWNDVDRTWDCPLHGSRFAPDGEVLTGPATQALPTTAPAVPTLPDPVAPAEE